VNTRNGISNRELIDSHRNWFCEIPCLGRVAWALYYLWVSLRRSTKDFLRIIEYVTDAVIGSLFEELSGKRLELLMEALPTVFHDIPG
jgi:hypothetical protein